MEILFKGLDNRPAALQWSALSPSAASATASLHSIQKNTNTTYLSNTQLPNKNV